MEDWRLLDLTDAAKQIGWKPERLRKAIQRGKGPRAVRVSGRRIEIEVKALREWIAEMKTIEPKESGVKSAEKVVAKVKGLVEANQEVTEQEFTRTKERLLPFLNNAQEGLDKLTSLREEHGPILDQLAALDWVRLYEIAGQTRAESLIHKVKAINKHVSDATGTLTTAIDQIKNLTPRSLGPHTVENLQYEATACSRAYKDFEDQYQSITNVIAQIEEAGDRKFEVASLKQEAVTGRPSSWDKAIG